MIGFFFTGTWGWTPLLSPYSSFQLWKTLFGLHNCFSSYTSYRITFSEAGNAHGQVLPALLAAGNGDEYCMSVVYYSSFCPHPLSCVILIVNTKHFLCTYFKSLVLESAVIYLLRNIKYIARPGWNLPYISVSRPGRCLFLAHLMTCTECSFVSSMCGRVAWLNLWTFVTII